MRSNTMLQLHWKKFFYLNHDTTITQYSNLNHSKCHGEETIVSSPPFVLIWCWHVGDIVPLVIVIPHMCKQTESNHLVEKKIKENIPNEK